MTSPHRIIAADASPLVPNIVRAALDLVERPAVVIEVRSGEDALQELTRGDIALVVSAFTLADDMRGFELALKANQAEPNTPVIILAGANDPDMDAETQDNSPFHYLVRANNGDRFVRLLRAVLDGEEPGEEAAEAPAVITNLGPVPKIDVDQFADILGTMLTDVGAMAIVLVDRTGNILQELGAVGYLDRERLTNTLAPAFANMVSVGPLVGGNKPSAMHFYDGDEFDIFALAVGLHHFMCLIFEGSAGSRAFGAVTMFGRRAVQEMLDVMGDAAFTIKAVEAAATPKAKSAVKPTAKKAAQQEPAAAEPTTEAAAYVPHSPPSLEPLPEDADLESMLKGLENLDMNQAADLFDPDKLAEIAAEKMAGERLTYEEAQQMGVLESNK